MDILSNILFIEKEPEHLNLITRSMEQAEYADFEITDCIDKAKKIIKEKNIDLIIADYELLNKKGADLLNKSEFIYDVPVIAMLEKGSDSLTVQVIKQGFIDCIVKTIETFEQLPVIISKAIINWANIKKCEAVEKNLEDLENKFMLISENISDIVWVVDSDLRNYNYVSPSIYNFLGYQPDEIISIPFAETLAKDSYNKIKKEFLDLKKNFKNGDIKSEDFNIITEAKFVHKNGTYCWGIIKAKVLVDKQQNDIIGINGVTIDITDKKKVEEELKIQETYFETLIDEAPVAIAIVNNKDQVQRVNKKFQSLFGYKPEEALGQPINELIVAEEYKEEGMYVTNIVAQGEQISFDSIRRDKSGKELHVSIIGKPVFFGEDQLAVFGIYQDITERKRNEFKFRELSERLMLATESAGIGIWDYDIKNKELHWEREMFKLLGVDEDINKNKELVKVFRNIVLTDDADRIFENLNNINDIGGHYEDRFKIKGKDGNTKFIKIVASLFKNDKPEPARVIGACWDITKEVEHGELKNKVEIADKVTRIKEQFVANMSHEIRSPLTGILGMTDLLLKTDMDEKQKEYAEIVRSSSQSLLNIVNDILDLSKIEAGKMELKPVVFNIKENGANVYKLFYALVQQKKLLLRINFDDNLPENIYADEHRLSQIITNLVSNAVKFTEKGSINLSYHLVEEFDNTYKIKVIVADTGIGISKENQEKLFNMFSQVDVSDTRIYEGTGLGLSISKRLVELMGGEIGMESDLGKGSKFWFTFNAKRVSDEQNLVESEIVGDFTKAPRPYNILLVEDKKTNQLVISLMLKEAGCKSDVVANGQEALEKFSPGKYDFILMDIQMPVMDGVTAVKELKNRYGSSALPVIIGLSAKAMEGDAEYYLSQGMDDYLTKPVSASKLVERFVSWDKKVNEE